MRAEASCGNSLVLFLIFLFVAPMQAYANTQANLTMLQRAWIFAIYAEAATAIFCLLGLMWDDPGTIKRTAENCFPLPDIVAEKLANGQSLESVGNVTGEDGRVFCIRCLVWRPDDGGNTHHCSTCQRCVCEFDHHCGVRAARASLARNTWPPPYRLPTTRAIQRLPLPPHCMLIASLIMGGSGQMSDPTPPSSPHLPTPRSPHATPPRHLRRHLCLFPFTHFPQVFGRCIAGDGCGGNMGYFKTLILMGVLGCGTCVSLMVVSSAWTAGGPACKCSPRRPPPHRYVRLFHGRLERPLRELPAPPSRLACLHPRLAWQHVLLGVERVPRPGAEPHDTLCTRTTCALRGPPPAPSLSRTGGRLADDRSFGLWGGEHKQAGGVSTVIAGSPRSHVVSRWVRPSRPRARAAALPGVTAPGSKPDCGASPSRTLF